MESKMLVEIWSDVVCPFCYIGKRKFEAALAQFQEREQVEVIWKSYQLMPDRVTDTSKNVFEMLAEKYGVSLEESKAMHQQVTATAAAVGLTYNFDKAVVVNTLKAHQLIHFAKAKGKQDEAEEALFYAYFTDGQHIDDIPTLLAIGTAIGLEESALKIALDSGAFVNAVEADIYEARQVGVRGVPFFVLDRKYAISGAQEPKDILTTLQRAFTEWRESNPENTLEISNGEICTPDKQCN